MPTLQTPMRGSPGTALESDAGACTPGVEAQAAGTPDVKAQGSLEALAATTRANGMNYEHFEQQAREARQTLTDVLPFGQTLGRIR